MSVAVRIPQVDVETAKPADHRATWFEVHADDLPHWNSVLLRANASVYQYPYWNEPYRPLGLKPRYLAWGTEARPLAFACILTVGLRPAKIGMVFRGPATLEPGVEISQSVVEDLLAWARAEGFMFLRMTHSDPETLRQVASHSDWRNFDAFPYFLDYPVMSHDFIVEQYESDEDTLATFDREVRRKIRRAEETGYEFRSDDSPEALEKLWPLYQECSTRKGFRLERPLSVYMNTMRLAQPHNCARLYSVYLNGKAVGSTLVVRDGATAHCVLAAFEAEHRQSAALLHWESMRDMYRLGARNYNLGPGPGSLARFKQQFSRHKATYPAPLTVVLNKKLFAVWWKMVFPVAKRLRPMLRKLVWSWPIKTSTNGVASKQKNTLVQIPSPGTRR
jgi:hypothetical protein